MVDSYFSVRIPLSAESVSTCPARRQSNEEVPWGPCSYSICIPGHVHITHKPTPPQKGGISHVDKYHNRCQSHSGHSPDQDWRGGSRQIDSQGRLLRAQVQMVGSWLPDWGGTNRMAAGKHVQGAQSGGCTAVGCLYSVSTLAPRPNLGCHNSTATETMQGNWLFSESHCCGYF